jgi:uncharacterized protein (DUF1015 family)
MPDVMPFRGVRYCASVVGGVEKVIAPPYDVVDSELYERLLAASPYNVVRLTLPASPRAHQAGTAAQKHYVQSAALFREWLARGVLRRDEAPAMYVYEQRFAAQGRRRSRTGLVALARLAEPGHGIRPHERTLSGPKTDRLKLLRATRVNFGQVFALYEDGQRQVDALLEEAKAKPCLTDVVENQGIGHTLWTITEPAMWKRLGAALREKEVFIADGHHRYATALHYMRENPLSPAARYRMMTLVSTSSRGLVVLPTHRAVRGLAPWDEREFLKKLEQQFSMERMARAGRQTLQVMRRALRARLEAGQHSLGLYLRGGNCSIATLREPSGRCGVKPPSRTWQQLDVAILHNLVLERILGIKPGGPSIEYVKDFESEIEASIRKVDSAEYQGMFFLNPPTVAQVVAVAREGGEMPQKSTFFYPKVYTGLVMRILDDSEVAQN